MNYGKSRFDFYINNVAQANNVIQDFLRLNNYTQCGQSHYSFYDPVIIGKGNLEYYINGNQITIFAYLGKPEKPVPLDNSLLLAVGKQGYLSKLRPLFDSLSNIDQQVGYNQLQDNYNQTMETQQPVYNQYTQNVPNNSVAHRMKVNNNKFAIIALIASIFSMLLACCGMMVGIIPQMAIFYLIYLGMKSEKKAMAIIALVINSLAILTTIIMIIFAILG